MSFKDWTPDQRAAALRKSHESRAANAAARKAADGDDAMQAGRARRAQKREAERLDAERDERIRDDAAPVRPPDEAPPPDRLTDAEREMIRSKALAQIARELADRRVKEREALVEQELADELRRQRIAAGLVVPSHKDDLITFVMDVAPFSPGMQVDGVWFYHGSQVTVPRHVYDSMRETMARTWDHEDACGYPNKKMMRPMSPGLTMNMDARHAYMRPHQTTISERTMAVVNSPIIGRL